MYFIKLFFIILAIYIPVSCVQEADVQDQQVSDNGKASSLIDGQKLYAKLCAGCHGRGGKGTKQGPPLIHKIYEPSHHNDASFYRAVKKGVQAHHWQFGNMPPIENISDSDMSTIIFYVRHQQRKVGIK